MENSGKMEKNRKLKLPIPPEPVEIKEYLRDLLKTNPRLVERELKQGTLIGQYLWSGKVAKHVKEYIKRKK